MGAKNWVRRVVQVRLRFIRSFSNHFFRIHRGPVTRHDTFQLSLPMSIGAHRLDIASHLRNRSHPCNHWDLLVSTFWQLIIATHRLDVIERPAHLVDRHHQRVFVPGFQQLHCLPLAKHHQSLPHSPTSSFSKVPPFGVLDMTSTSNQCQPHICQWGSNQRPTVFFCFQCRQNLVLNVTFQHFQTTITFNLNSPSSWEGFEEDMGFSIVAERLKMPDPLYWSSNGFFV